ncbi:uncharacterized protein LOC112194821 [Rosa chinensis]|uniref:uncharacterized protein LOC112194821 n=1 Tax=Rosa chinensis TaxID=74649 RepID=UPI001AD90A22|nr:uncharacterized protein LOC112194821 [Rosa chinensis]
MGLLGLGPFAFLWWCLLRFLYHPGDHLFIVRIHHGGRFYSNGGINRQYKGAEGVAHVDGVDPDKISVTGFNYWAYDLGYTHGPIMYWYRIPGSEPGTGYLPVVTDADAMDMLQFIPSRDRILDVYFVCLAGMRHFQDWELDNFDDEVEHLLYLGHFIKDLPLSALEEEQLGPVGEDADQGGSDVEDHVIGQDGGNGGPSNAPTDGPRSGASRPTHVPRNAPRRQVSRRRPTVGINIREPSALVQGSQASVQVSGLTTNSAKEKGKQKLDEVGKKKGKKPKKTAARRYETRGGGECSYAAPEDDGWSSETTDSDDPNYDGFVDSDYELFDEEDEVSFEKNVDGDLSKVAEWEEMGFEGNISDAEADDSNGFPSIGNLFPIDIETITK